MMKIALIAMITTLFEGLILAQPAAVTETYFAVLTDEIKLPVDGKCKKVEEGQRELVVYGLGDKRAELKAGAPFSVISKDGNIIHASLMNPDLPEKCPHIEVDGPVDMVPLKIEEKFQSLRKSKGGAFLAVRGATVRQEQVGKVTRVDIPSNIKKDLERKVGQKWDTMASHSVSLISPPGSSEQYLGVDIVYYEGDYAKLGDKALTPRALFWKKSGENWIFVTEFKTGVNVIAVTRLSKDDDFELLVSTGGGYASGTRDELWRMKKGFIKLSDELLFESGGC